MAKFSPSYLNDRFDEQLGAVDEQLGTAISLYSKPEYHIGLLGRMIPFPKLIYIEKKNKLWNLDLYIPGILRPRYNQMQP